MGCCAKKSLSSSLEYDSAGVDARDVESGGEGVGRRWRRRRGLVGDDILDDIVAAFLICPGILLALVFTRKVVC